MHEYYEESLTFSQTKAAVLELLRSSDQPMSVRDIGNVINDSTYLWDCLLALEATHLIDNVGSLMISKWVAKKVKAPTVNTKACSECARELPLVEFYQEWSGAPSSKCKECKIASQKRRGRRRNGEGQGTEEPQSD